MIVSTIPLESELPCVVVRSAILNTDDLLDVQRKVFELIEDDGDKEIPEMQLDVINPVESDIQGAFYNLLSQGRVMVDYEADDWEDAVRQSGILLRDSGAVTDAYVDAMVENIKENGPYVVIWPGTALPHADCLEGVPMEAMGVAIPHTDAIHVNKKAVFCGILDKPVDFVVMGDDEATVSVEVIFMLAIMKPNDQI